MPAGIVTPKCCSTVGAMSIMLARPWLLTVIGRLEISMPAVVAKSYPPWSPDHFLRLGYMTPFGDPPSVVCQDTR